MKKTLFAGLILFLVVSLLCITSCSKSMTTSMATPSSTIASSPSQKLSTITASNQSSSSITKAANSTSVSVGFDWSTIPIYPNFAENSKREIGEQANYHAFTTNETTTDTATTILNWYKSQLPDKGWTIGIFNTNSQYVQATNTEGYNLNVSVVGPGGSSGCEIDISYQ
jgi:hypothetical protein